MLRTPSYLIDEFCNNFYDSNSDLNSLFKAKSFGDDFAARQRGSGRQKRPGNAIRLPGDCGHHKTTDKQTANELLTR